MSGFRTPPQGDFASYEALLGQQGEHFSAMTSWSADQCANTQGLDGLLTPLQDLVPPVAHFFDEKLAQCGRGMHLVAGKVHQTSENYTRTDATTAAALRALYPSAFPGFPAFGSLPGASLVGNFTDEQVSLTEPPSADDTTSKAIKTALMVALKSGDLKAANHLFVWCTGQSLVDLLITPLFGEFGRLRYLHDAYDQLGDGVYTVAGTLRKGAWKLGSEWQGQTATNFDQYLFQWSMGIGGVGDAAKIAAKAFKDGYDVICELVWAALSAIGKLMDLGIHKLAEIAVKLLAGDAAIEAVGGGPEDPVADVVAIGFSAYELYEMYKVVRQIINDIGLIETIFQEIGQAVDKIKSAVHSVVEFINSPPSIGSLIDDVEQHGFEFEKNGWWSPDMGTARIGMLPAA